MNTTGVASYATHTLAGCISASTLSISLPSCTSYNSPPRIPSIELGVTALFAYVATTLVIICQTGSQYGSNTEFVAEHGRDRGAVVVREAEWVTKRSPRHLLFKAFSAPINIDVAIEREGRRGRY
ncbi:hypothetical protein PILCRDRAFT_12769 [Piloderma croceum F 1598]|uniref:Uncharacterized protein n=1 Tax=Piloderma croceum (strain F 1598) TaxID=765440 RepID=A0A0C3ARH2_PILCF|nr:hypothetical protein PILCRDRAFT_12769 [Piloderma croceum F 1598]